MPTVELVRIGSPGITALAITLNHPGVIDPTSFDSKMEEVTGGLHLIDKDHFDPSCQVEISAMKYVVYMFRNREVTLYGFPEPILCREFVSAAQGSVQGRLVSAGHIRVVQNNEAGSVKRSVIGLCPESLQETNLLSPKSSESFRTGRLRQELGSYFDFDDGVIKGSPKFGLQTLRRLPHF